MYNLLIGLTRGKVRAERLLEYTDDGVREYLGADAEGVRVDRLLNLPTLLMPEIGSSGEPQVAHIGHVAKMNKIGDIYTFAFGSNPATVPIPTARIKEVAEDLGIADDWEFTRTHWAVKDVDLYRALGSEISGVINPKVFKLPLEEPFDPDLVAVMMPFNPRRFGSVYESLKVSVESAGMRCLRADDIWERDHILGDVLSLIWRARVIIADLSEKNSNVFYETGIAHTLGRDTILISQAAGDIPFDLQAIRSLEYRVDNIGLGDLAKGIADRLKTITASGLV